MITFTGLKVISGIAKWTGTNWRKMSLLRSKALCKYNDVYDFLNAHATVNQPCPAAARRPICSAGEWGSEPSIVDAASKNIEVTVDE
ncbi:MAG: hypothetical protein KKA07_00610 [Bacteroidetes bacterium]|nr:hypothetical protein [Bacteroidota bacterium]MBU1717552.1 hypothetical protein [Bacteroidota bacterium]